MGISMTRHLVLLLSASAGIASNETSDQVTLRDFSAFDLGITSFDAGAQVRGGYQGWTGPVTGIGTTDDEILITGYYDMVNC